MLYHWLMYNSDSIIKHPRTVEVKTAEILKAKAKIKPHFNDEQLDMNPSHSQTRNPNLDRHQIPCQNYYATTTDWSRASSPGGLVLVRRRKEEWLRRSSWMKRDSSRSSSASL